MRIQHSLHKIGLLAGIIGIGLYSLPVMAVISNCTAGDIISRPFVMNPLPTTLTNGFVLGSRSVTTPFTYNKTTNTSEGLYIGAWYSTGNVESAFNTLPVFGTAQGVGVRLVNKDTGVYADRNTFNRVNTYFTNIPGNNFSITEEWILELVVVNASIYKGGKITGFSPALSMVFGNQKVWNDRMIDNSAGRCSAIMALIGIDVITQGSGTAPELPIPKNPTCDLGGTNIAVSLPDVDSSTLKNSGDISGSKSFSIPLGNCGKDAKPYITFTDSNNNTNRSTTLGLAAGSTAAGVGIVIEKSGGDFVQFGAQNTSVSGSNVGQFLIGTAVADGSSIPLALTAKYIRTNAALKVGEVKADAIFTIAYP
ncbi:fimbrial protein [Serratia sp. L9]|uniref:fimbrial protein n=1 Tax=Serratia sp. L9 TaxID=3423946 RepID=UPI003D67D36D